MGFSDPLAGIDLVFGTSILQHVNSEMAHVKVKENRKKEKKKKKQNMQMTDIHLMSFELIYVHDI